MEASQWNNWFIANNRLKALHIIRIKGHTPPFWIGGMQQKMAGQNEDDFPEFELFTDRPPAYRIRCVILIEGATTRSPKTTAAAAYSSLAFV